ncbi:hypothetical protein HK105_203017 [Polyrhizophydium stewartii]|uniref:Fanconi anaemia group A protein helical domain-containing protein n=1 Tax=Polyrhizophydium stewartii TaxID=2732419 RepID=A0ABR4NCU6_9FUNG
MRAATSAADPRHRFLRAYADMPESVASFDWLDGGEPVLCVAGFIIECTRSGDAASDRAGQASGRLAEWVLAARGEPFFGVAAQALCEAVFLSQADAAVPTVASVCAAVVQALEGQVSPDERAMRAAWGQILMDEQAWRRVMDAALQGQANSRVLLGSLHSLALVDKAGDVGERARPYLDAAVRMHSQPAFALVVGCMAAALAVEPAGLGRQLRAVLTSNASLALKPARDWAVQTLQAAVPGLPVVAIKQLGVALRQEPQWAAVVDGVKTRLAVLGESLGDRPSVPASLQAEKVLEYFEVNGTVPAALVDASIFHVQWYTKTFLPQLLRGSPRMNAASRVRLVQALRQADRIPRRVLEDFEKEQQREQQQDEQRRDRPHSSGLGRKRRRIASGTDLDDAQLAGDGDGHESDDLEGDDGDGADPEDDAEYAACVSDVLLRRAPRGSNGHAAQDLLESGKAHRMLQDMAPQIEAARVGAKHGSGAESAEKRKEQDEIADLRQRVEKLEGMVARLELAVRSIQPANSGWPRLVGLHVERDQVVVSDGGQLHPVEMSFVWAVFGVLDGIARVQERAGKGDDDKTADQAGMAAQQELAQAGERLLRRVAGTGGLFVAVVAVLHGSVAGGDEALFEAGRLVRWMERIQQQAAACGLGTWERVWMFPPALEWLDDAARVELRDLQARGAAYVAAAAVEAALARNAAPDAAPGPAASR